MKFLNILSHLEFKKLDHVSKQGAVDVILHLQQIGALNGQLTENILFDLYPDLMMKLFFDHQLERCVKNSDEYLCFTMSTGWKFTTEDKKDATRVLKHLKLSEDQITEIVDDFIHFLRKKKLIQDEFEEMSESSVVKIADLSEKFPQINLDWLKLINSQMLSDLKVSENDEIFIENPRMMTEHFNEFANLKSIGEK